MLSQTLLYREFAVDPQILNSVDAIRKFLAFFGWEKGNIICAIPTREKWHNYICESSNLRLGQVQHLLKKVEIERVSDNGKDCLDWTEWVSHEHRRNPFKAILCSDESYTKLKNIIGANDFLVNWDEIIDYNSYFWGTHKRVLREPAEMSSSIELLLCNSPSITFVDPHFKFEEDARYQSSISSMLMKSFNKRYPNPPECFYLHCQYPDCLSKRQRADLSRFPPLDENSDFQKRNEVLSELKKIFKPFFEKMLPTGCTLTMFFWLRDAKNRIRMHNRYVFSRTGGVMFGQGLDPCTKEIFKSEAKDDVAILSQKAHDEYSEIYLFGDNFNKRTREQKNNFLTFTIERNK